MTLTIGGKRKERAYSEHKPKWQRFQSTLMVHSTQSAVSQQKTKQKTTLHPYQRQYAHVYHQRLTALKPRCWQAVSEEEKDVVKVDRVLDLRENVRSVVVGTLVKEGGNGQEVHPQSRCQASQSLFIEDESGRANIDVENVHDFATGMVLGLLGAVGKHGHFQVERVFFPALPPHPTTISATTDDSKNKPPALGNPHLLLISGLHCGDPSLAPAQRQMLLDYIRGSFGDNSGGGTISHVIIAGGSTVLHDEHPTVALKELDGFCLQLGAMNVPVDILPGKDDPTTANWPQRPLHKSLLQYSDRKVPHLVSRVPNPYGAMHANKYVLGTDGTNATDLARHLLKPAKEEKQSDDSTTKESKDDNTNEEESNEEPTMVPVSHLQALRRTLQCGHICPTGPDSVPTMPHPETDPMVLPETPHLYFAGNCDEFATEVMTQNKTTCRLVCIPRFADSGKVVLVNLDTMEAKGVRVVDPGV
ncbi:polymerase delta subunit 2 [Seminavis robusta]|uniref:Polymerase delta subunit 2 n=1 Tax=Seminavis robusta TaxID=568900 RepID=A0A9N8E9A9_9STRA|nr:polymerase delta subunit 2 [Seminavis robusta]|eukprot:Sro635_g179200.1 polymerase delta subunit 2 (474) ;mRNA; r:50046-51467